MNDTEEIALVDTGRIVITERRGDSIAGRSAHRIVASHAGGLGDLCEEDKAANDFPRLTESRLLSADPR